MCVCVSVCKCVYVSVQKSCSLRAEDICVHVKISHINCQYMCIVCVFVFSEPDLTDARVSCSLCAENIRVHMKNTHVNY